MERLTKRLDDGQAVMDCKSCELCAKNCVALACRNRLKDRLAAYEDTGLGPEEVATILRRTAEHDKAMEEGRLAELPCKVGDDVFFNIWNIKSQKYETLPGTIKNVRYDAMDGSVMVSNGEYFRVLGRDAFLSRPEAEAALDGGGEDFPPEAGDPDVSMTQPDGSPWPF